MNYSNTNYTHTDTRRGPLCVDEDVRIVRLSNKLVVPDAEMSLMSVPALFQKNIGVIFMPRYAVLFDLLD